MTMTNSDFGVDQRYVQIYAVYILKHIQLFVSCTLDSKIRPTYDMRVDLTF